MEWMLVLLMFNVQTGELQTHTEQFVATQQQCYDQGALHTQNVELPDGMKGSFICLPKTMFTPPPQPPKEEEKKRGFRLFG
jgi:hypothetical protein